MKRTVLVLSFVLLSAPALAQFSGPSERGQASTVAQVSNARLGSYVILTGSVVAHQRSDYFIFRDQTGDIRVEIEPNVWQERMVTPEMKVRLLGEVDQGRAGRYLWVKSLGPQ